MTEEAARRTAKLLARGMGITFYVAVHPLLRGDSTAQFIEWFKTPMPCLGIFEFYR